MSLYRCLQVSLTAPAMKTVWKLSFLMGSGTTTAVARSDHSSVREVVGRFYSLVSDGDVESYGCQMYLSLWNTFVEAFGQTTDAALTTPLPTCKYDDGSCLPCFIIRYGCTVSRVVC